MKIFRKRTGVMLLFGLTLVSVLAGAAYAQWTDSIKTTVVAQTWYYDIENSFKKFKKMTGNTKGTISVDGTNITGTVTKYDDGDKLRFVYRFENNSSVPVTIDNVYLYPAGFSWWETDEKDALSIKLKVRHNDSLNDRWHVNEERTYAEWEADPSIRSLLSSDPVNLQIGEEVVIRLVIDSEEQSWWWPIFEDDSFSIENRLDYSVYQ